MWFTKFLDTMSRFLPVSIPNSTLENLAKLNPNKFYVENVRSLMNVSTEKAKSLCDTAVRQGFFSTGLEIICPDGTVAKSIESGENIPETVICYLEAGNSYEEVELETNELERNTYYRLNQSRTAATA